jgi:hypothetical protein
MSNSADYGAKPLSAKSQQMGNVMEKFEGDCISGPLNGQRLEHWARTKKFYRPMVAMTFPMNEDAPVEAIEIGEYKLNDFGQWHWWETESGRAFNKLFGQPRT